MHGSPWEGRELHRLLLCPAVQWGCVVRCLLLMMFSEVTCLLLMKISGVRRGWVRCLMIGGVVGVGGAAVEVSPVQ